MKRTKMLIGLILCLCMILSSIPAFAVDTGTLKINCVDTSGSAVGGGMFTVRDSHGTIINTFTMDSTGIKVITGLEANLKYTVEEIIAPDGYVIEDESAVKVADVETSKTTELVYVNTLNNFGNIKITSVDTDGNPLKDTVFQIRKYNGAAIETIQTNAAGVAVSTNLTTGKYIIQEMIAPDGYIPDATTRTIDVKAGVQSQELFTNKQESRIVIYSYDSYGAVVPNTSYKITNATSGIHVETVTVDATGYGISSLLEPGYYMVEEVTVPDGYIIEKVAYNTILTEKDQTSTVRFIHTPKSTLRIETVDAFGNAIPGATYSITSVTHDYFYKATAGADGTFTTGVLNPNTYEVRQLTVPDGYLLNTNTQTIVVTYDKTEIAEFINDVVTGLEFSNICTQTGDGISGSTFKLTYEDGTFIGMYTTNSEGKISVTLQPGNYYITQTYVTQNVELDKTPMPFTVVANTVTKKNFYNSMISGVSVKVIDGDSNIGIQNVVLEFFDKNDNLVGKYKTNEDGFISFDGTLEAGNYTVKMVSVPDGYVIDTLSKTLSVTAGNNASLTWKIYGETGQIRIVTYAGEDSVMSNTYKNTLLKGVTYNILNSKGDVVKTVSDSNGYTYSGSLPLGTYYIEQVGAPAGYGVNSARVTVNITSENNDVSITVYDPAGDYRVSLDMKGPAIVYSGNVAKYYLADIHGAETNDMTDVYINMNIPYEYCRATLFYTGTFNMQVTYSVQYKTNKSSFYITLGENLNSKSTYSFDLRKNLTDGEYVTDIRYVFPQVYKQFASSTAPSFYAEIPTTAYGGLQISINAEIGGKVGGAYYTAASTYTSYVYGTNYNNSLPTTLPKTGY